VCLCLNAPFAHRRYALSQCREGTASPPQCHENPSGKSGVWLGYCISLTPALIELKLCMCDYVDIVVSRFCGADRQKVC